MKIGNHKHLEKLLKEVPFWDIIAKDEYGRTPVDTALSQLKEELSLD